MLTTFAMSLLAKETPVNTKWNNNKLSHTSSMIDEFTIPLSNFSIETIESTIAELESELESLTKSDIGKNNLLNDYYICIIAMCIIARSSSNSGHRLSLEKYTLYRRFQLCKP